MGFHYRHPPNDVRQVLVEAVRGTPGVLGTPSPDCFPVDYAESAVTYALRYWIADLVDDAAIDGEVRTRVWYAARRAGLEMPFPIRTVLTSATPAEQANVEGEKADRVSALGGIDLFAPLALAERVHLASSLRTERFGRGEQIVRQGDPGNSLYLICTGEVAVHLEGDGVRREVATLRARDFFGEMSLMTGEPHSATCTAKSDAVCYVLQHTALRQLLAERSQIAEDLSAVLARRTALLDDQRAGLSEEARARREAEAQSHVLARIRECFRLG